MEAEQSHIFNMATWVGAFNPWKPLCASRRGSAYTTMALGRLIADGRAASWANGPRRAV